MAIRWSFFFSIVLFMPYNLFEPNPFSRNGIDEKGCADFASNPKLDIPLIEPCPEMIPYRPMNSDRIDPS
jgi:hypothetical protein